MYFSLWEVEVPLPVFNSLGELSGRLGMEDA